MWTYALLYPLTNTAIIDISFTVSQCGQRLNLFTNDAALFLPNTMCTCLQTIYYVSLPQTRSNEITSMFVCAFVTPKRNLNYLCHRNNNGNYNNCLCIYFQHGGRQDMNNTSNMTTWNWTLYCSCWGEISTFTGLSVSCQKYACKNIFYGHPFDKKSRCTQCNETDWRDKVTFWLNIRTRKIGYTTGKLLF